MIFDKESIPKINLPRLFIVILSLAVIASIYLAYTTDQTKHISESVLRLHIVANSDSEDDQALKLKVRDEIIKQCSPLFENCKTANESKVVASNNIEFINNVANNVIGNNGYAYAVECKIEECNFPTKSYRSVSDGNVSLPSGEYNALNIRIGSATGQNWWCVMYPPLCFVDGVVSVSEYSESILRDELTDSEYELITNDNEPSIKVKFKIAEMLGKK